MLGGYVSYGGDIGAGAGEDNAKYGEYGATTYIDDEGVTGVTSGTEASKDGWGVVIQPFGFTFGFVGGDVNKRLNTGYKRVTVILGVSLIEHFDERGYPTGFGIGFGNFGIGQFIVRPDVTLIEGETNIVEDIGEGVSEAIE